jgi:hypothetical protein
MTTPHPVDEARLGLMLNEPRLPTIKTLWPRFAETADREGWEGRTEAAPGRGNHSRHPQCFMP